MTADPGPPVPAIGAALAPDPGDAPGATVDSASLSDTDAADTQEEPLAPEDAPPPPSRLSPTRRPRELVVRPPPCAAEDLPGLLELLAEYLFPLEHLRVHRRRSELRCTPRAALDLDALNQVVATLESQGATVTFLYRD